MANPLALRGIQQQVGQPINNQDDPLGIMEQTKGLESYLQGTADAARAGTLQSVVMPTPDQAGLQQSLKDANAVVKAPKLPGDATGYVPPSGMTPEQAEFYRKNPKTPIPPALLGIQGAMNAS